MKRLEILNNLEYNSATTYFYFQWTFQLITFLWIVRKEWKMHITVQSGALKF